MNSFYFYDLETSGLDARGDRIMQFAGIRTDMEFNQVGEATNLLVELAEDTLPGPIALSVTGITPNMTRTDGVSEREFCRFLTEEVATVGTTIMGYNSVRFDDEFVRNTLWRNFYDPYEWQWKDGRSRWDLLDVVRMVRALRPEGIEWPVTAEGKATNRLELMTKANGLKHEHAHDALSDVEALISVTKLIKEKQPAMFDFLYKMRNKREVQALVNLERPQMFVYTSGRYAGEFGKTTVAFPIAMRENGNVLVYDLRWDLDEALERESIFPVVKRLQYNHCPAVAPVSVLEKDGGWEKIGLTRETAEKNLKKLLEHPEFIEKMGKEDRPEYQKAAEVEDRLYDGFLNDKDRRLCEVVRSNEGEDLEGFYPPFDDERLPELLLHYRGKNFPETLSASETEEFEKYRRARLERQAPKFLKELEMIREKNEFIYQELVLWYQNVV